MSPGASGRIYGVLGFRGGYDAAGLFRLRLFIRELPFLNKDAKMKTLYVVIGTVFIGFASAANAQTSLYTDSFGNTTGTKDGQSVNLHKDSFGNTTGSVGNNSVNTHSDSFGNTTGSFGNNSVNTHSDSFGNTTGSVGNNSVNTHRDSFGNTTGR